MSEPSEYQQEIAAYKAEVAALAEKGIEVHPIDQSNARQNIFYKHHPRG